jgi:XTP/dITP diphosphohydrolase
VYFHSRIAEEHPTDPFTIDDVAGAIADKLISRHPHVFENLEVSGTDEIIENWEAIKAREKGRTSAVDGIAMSQPALPLVSKIIYRAEKYNVPLNLEPHERNDVATEESVGSALASIIAWAHHNGIDPESALRAKAREMMREIAAKEKHS